MRSIYPYARRYIPGAMGQTDNRKVVHVLWTHPAEGLWEIHRWNRNKAQKCKPYALFLECIVYDISKTFKT